MSAECRGMSLDGKLEEQKISGIILLERLLYELKYFSETG